MIFVTYMLRAVVWYEIYWNLGKNFVKASMCKHRLVGEDGGNRLRPPLWIVSALMLGFVQVMCHAGCLLAIWLVAFLLTNATCTWTDDWLPAQLVERCVLIRIHQLRFPAMQFWILFLRLFFWAHGSNLIDNTFFKFLNLFSFPSTFVILWFINSHFLSKFKNS